MLPIPSILDGWGGAEGNEQAREEIGSDRRLIAQQGAIRDVGLIRKHPSGPEPMTWPWSFAAHCRRKRPRQAGNVMVLVMKLLLIHLGQRRMGKALRIEDHLLGR